jgi:hypothetical protein
MFEQTLYLYVNCTAFYPILHKELECYLIEFAEEQQENVNLSFKMNSKQLNSHLDIPEDYYELVNHVIKILEANIVSRLVIQSNIQLPNTWICYFMKRPINVPLDNNNNNNTSDVANISTPVSPKSSIATTNHVFEEVLFRTKPLGILSELHIHNNNNHHHHHQQQHDSRSG